MKDFYTFIKIFKCWRSCRGHYLLYYYKNTTRLFFEIISNFVPGGNVQEEKQLIGAETEDGLCSQLLLCEKQNVNQLMKSVITDQQQYICYGVNVS